MNIIALKIGLILTLLLFNALFAMAEISIISARKSRLQQLANKGHKGATEALLLASSPNRFLSTIQIGITLISILLGAFGGSTLAEKAGLSLFEKFGLRTDLAEALGFVFVIGAITYISVILGELVPKRLALKYPEKIAIWIAYPMNVLARISFPIVWFFSHSTEFILRLLHLDKDNSEPTVTHEDLKALVDQGVEEGVLDEQEKMMMQRVLSFEKKRVTSIMTLARDVIWIDTKSSIQEQLDGVLNTHFSNFPVAEGSLNNLQGTIRAIDLCHFMHNMDVEKNLSLIIYQPLYIPESTNALQSLELFRKTGLQMGFVIDEFGDVQGLLTLTNLLEAIVGDISVNELPENKPMMQREDGSWLVDGSLSIDAFKDKLQIDAIEGENDNLFQTLAGFVMHKLGRVPIPTDNFIWRNLRFEVLDMEKNRVNKILVCTLSNTSTN